MEKIFYKKVLLGTRIKRFEKGSNPLTDDAEFIQALSLKHPKGSYLKAHYHKPMKRVTSKVQECLIVQRGRVKLDLYGYDNKFFKFIFLGPGEVFILLNGAFGIHMVKDSELIEVKNGPFKKDKILI